MTNYIHFDRGKHNNDSSMHLCMSKDQRDMYEGLFITSPESNNLMHDDTSDNSI